MEAFYGQPQQSSPLPPAAACARQYLQSIGRPPAEARVLVLGIGCGQSACRPGAPCTIRSLRQAGALVDFYDPHITEYECDGIRTRGLARLTCAALRRYDMVIVERPCPGTDYGAVAASARWVLDAGGALRGCGARHNIHPL